MNLKINKLELEDFQEKSIIYTVYDFARYFNKIL